MRLRVLYVLMILFCIVFAALAQDLDATATAIIEGATQTAIAETNQPQVEVSPDNFSLTATALVRSATETAEAFTGETAVPITAESQSEDSFELTATALVAEATRQASESTPTEQATNAFAMSGTVVVFGGLIVALLILGVVIVVVAQRNPGKRG